MPKSVASTKVNNAGLCNSKDGFYENTCSNDIPKSSETELNTLKEKVKLVFNDILDRCKIKI